MLRLGHLEPSQVFISKCLLCYYIWCTIADDVHRHYFFFKISHLMSKILIISILIAFYNIFWERYSILISKIHWWTSYRLSKTFPTGHKLSDEKDVRFAASTLLLQLISWSDVRIFNIEHSCSIFWHVLRHMLHSAIWNRLMDFVEAQKNSQLVTYWQRWVMMSNWQFWQHYFISYLMLIFLTFTMLTIFCKHVYNILSFSTTNTAFQ